MPIIGYLTAPSNILLERHPAAKYIDATCWLVVKLFHLIAPPDGCMSAPSIDRKITPPVGYIVAPSIICLTTPSTG